MSIRKWHVGQALNSFKDLNEILGELTEEEVMEALRIESSSRRRRTVIDRLISRAVRLNELIYSRQLKEKFHGTHPEQGSDGP